MSGDPKYTTPRRLWVAQPRKMDGWKSHHKVRTVNDYEVTKPWMLERPEGFIGNGHEPWHLYYHVDEITRLEDEIKTLKQCLFQMQNAAIDLTKQVGAKDASEVQA